MISICEFLSRFKSKLSNNGALDYGEIFVHTHNKGKPQVHHKKVLAQIIFSKKNNPTAVFTFQRVREY